MDSQEIAKVEVALAALKDLEPIYEKSTRDMAQLIGQVPNTNGLILDYDQRVARVKAACMTASAGLEALHAMSRALGELNALPESMRLFAQGRNLQDLY